METLKYIKIREVKSPCRAHEFDAGIDFFVPSNLTLDDMTPKFETTSDHPRLEFNDDGTIKMFKLAPGQSILIPSGIKVKVPEGYMLQFNNKSGVASKKHLLIGASIVDIGYEGEVHLNLHNVSNYDQIVNAGDKIVQGILVKIGFHVPEEMKDEADLYGNSHSERGDGGFGSSGTK